MDIIIIYTHVIHRKTKEHIYKTYIKLYHVLL